MSLLRFEKHRSRWHVLCCCVIWAAGVGCWSGVFTLSWPDIISPEGRTQTSLLNNGAETRQRLNGRAGDSIVCFGSIGPLSVEPFWRWQKAEFVLKRKKSFSLDRLWAELCSSRPTRRTNILDTDVRCSSETTKLHFVDFISGEMEY